MEFSNNLGMETEETCSGNHGSTSKSVRGNYNELANERVESDIGMERETGGNGGIEMEQKTEYRVSMRGSSDNVDAILDTKSVNNGSQVGSVFDHLKELSEHHNDTCKRLEGLLHIELGELSGQMMSTTDKVLKNPAT
ncbi:hypothetical protein L916_08273 [Phytophthora nicotianae]|uniref:Uncharacterized protein n=1 Tax=Phytophthora nicotianae TaxID=4792 RepID=W2J2I9_PHYNI|nr:hypothetical protein L916_08273 [Phytophthora nicotianae]